MKDYATSMHFDDWPTRHGGTSVVLSCYKDFEEIDSFRFEACPSVNQTWRVDADLRKWLDPCVESAHTYGVRVARVWRGRGRIEDEEFRQRIEAMFDMIGFNGYERAEFDMGFREELCWSRGFWR